MSDNEEYKKESIFRLMHFLHVLACEADKLAYQVNGNWHDIPDEKRINLVDAIVLISKEAGITKEEYAEYREGLRKDLYKC